MGIENVKNYKLEVDRGDSSLECFYRATHNYGPFNWHPVPARERIQLLSLLSLFQGGPMKDEDIICCDCLKKGLEIPNG